MIARKVLITDDVHPLLISGFKEMGFDVDYHPKIELEAVRKMVYEYEGMIINSKTICDQQMFDAASNLRFLGRLGSGMEIIDQTYAAQKGVAVFSAPDGNCNAVGEHALGMLLALANKMRLGDKMVRQKKWNREACRGFEIAGKTVSIIGFGHTGNAFAQKLKGMDVRVLAYDKYKENYADHLDFVEESTMEKIYQESDVLSFHLPLTPEVIHLADDTYFTHFQKDIVVINTSRGKVIPTQTLINGLRSGKLIGACLDVFENEKTATFTAEEHALLDQLYAFENTIFSPHVAGWTVESKERLAAILLRKIKDLYTKTT